MSSLRPEQTLLHFRIAGKVGQGGMGEVYKAFDTRLARPVAIKILPAAIANSPKARSRLLQEARSASSLNHPNIVTIHSIEQIDGMDFIVMEFVEGQKLSNRIAASPMDLPTLNDIAIQIADALGAAHSAGIIHRDIKSDNILITSRGKVKVLDFGLAKTLFMTSAVEEHETLEQITEEGALLGTVHYMSPEQTRGERLDARSDVFSFGCVLYQMVTGRLPFQGNNLPGVLYQISNVDPPSSLSFRADLPLDFEDVIKRGLSKNKEDRFASGTEILDALKRIAQGSVQYPTQILAEQPKISLLVGRETEQQQLVECLEQARRGRGKTVFVTGEPGIGKTSLADDFLRPLNRTHPEIVIGRGRCVEQYGTAQAYLPFSDAISSLLSGPARERMVTLLRAHAPTWHIQFPAAFASTGALEKSRSESVGATKERMLREIAEAIFAFTAGSPLVLVLEDMHWADPSSIDLLRYLSQRLPENRLMILGTFRAEDVEANNPPMKAYLLEMRAHNLCEQISLGLLTRQHIEQFLETNFFPNRFSGELSALIHAKTEGHPLFITSLLQFLSSQQLITREGEEWVLSRPGAEIKLEVPENVKSMLRKKIDALTEEDRKVLQYASIEGEEFTSTILAEVLETEEVELEERLQHIQTNYGLILPLGEEVLPDGALASKYRFMHSLYQNALYGDLVTKRRILLHRRAGESMLKHYGEQAPKIANRLGGHFQLGRDFERAVEFLSYAGENAANIYASAEAENLYRRALEQLEELRKQQGSLGDKWINEAAKLDENLADVLARSGRQLEARTHYQEALKLTSSGKFLDMARLNRKTAKAWETERNFEAALNAYIHSEKILEQAEQVPQKSWWEEWLQLGLDRMWLHYTQNQIPELESLTSKIEPHIYQQGSASQRARFFWGRILASWRRDRYFLSKSRADYCQKFLQAAGESGNLHELANAKFCTGFDFLWRSDFPPAVDYLKDSLAMNTRLGDRVLESRCWTYLSITYRKLRDIEATREYNAKTLDVSKATNMAEYVAAGHANLAWLAAIDEEFEEVEANANTALKIWSSIPVVYPFQGLALWPLIELEISQGRIADAIDHAQLLLLPAQQRLSDRLTQTLEEAIRNSEGLEKALSIARAEFHL